MKSLKRKLMVSTSLGSTALVLILGFQNCSPGVVQSAKLAPVKLASTGTLDLDSDTKPVTTAYSENLMLSMQQMTGVETPSNGTITTANATKTKVSETGKADALNAPMMIAVANLAGDMCLDLINQEKAKTDTSTRRFFNKVDFARGPASLSSEAKDEVIRRMARNFWGRNETVAERTLIRTTLESSLGDAKPANFASDAQETENALILVCTSMLASLDAIRF